MRRVFGPGERIRSGGGRPSRVPGERAWAGRVAAILLLAAAAPGCGPAGSTPELGFAPAPAPAPAQWRLEPANLLEQPLEVSAVAWTLDLVSEQGVLHEALLDGFSVPEVDGTGSFVWALGARSRVRFPLERVESLELGLRARPFAHPGAPVQRITVSVNGQWAGEIALEGFASDHTITLPVAALRSGWNELELAYAWSREPRAVLPGSRDPRPLSVAYERLRLVKRGAAVEHGAAALDGGAPGPALALHGSGSLSWLLRIPAGAALDLDWVRPAGARPASARVLLEHDGGLESLLDVAPAGTGPVTIDLGAWAGRAARLRLEVEGVDPGARWLWTRADLRSGAARMPAGPAPSLPGANVVFVVIDAAQRARFGIYGHEGGATPRIDALAQDALVFERAHSTAPYTLASTVSLFTSQLPPEHGVIEKEHQLGEHVPVLAEALRDAGHATAAFSANAFVTEQFGLARGFETFEALFQDRPGGVIVPAEEMNAAALAWLEAHRAGEGERPFFLYLHYIQPHEPYDAAPDRYYEGLEPDYDGPIDGSVANMYEVFAGRLVPDARDRTHLERLYEGNLRYVDAAIGRLLDRLEASGLLERTLVIVTSDHGEALGERGLYGHNTSVDETMTAIPLLVRLPGAFPGRRAGRSDEPVSTIDLAPLVLESVGAPTPDTFTGRNPLRPLFGGRAAPARLLYSRTPGVSPEVALWSPESKCVFARDGSVLAGPAEAVDARSIATKSAPVTADLCRFARRALEPGKPSPGSRTRGRLSEQERAALEALGYLRD